VPLPIEVGRQLSAAEEELQSAAKRTYAARLEAGVAREQARKDLPLATYTEAYWKIDLHNLLHFLSLRMDPHAQQEIRDYATTIGEQIVRPLFPVVAAGTSPAPGALPAAVRASGLRSPCGASSSC
jgi:thymidylate synthase (FAD)